MAHQGRGSKRAGPAQTGSGLPWRLATAGGLGRVPLAPGTAGSLLGLLTCAPALLLPWPAYLAVLLAVAGAAVWAADRVAAELGVPDPPAVVADEIAGMWAAALCLPLTAYDLAAAFLLFRLFDVVKPGPLLRLERIRGGWGIVLDDLAAGLLARASWWLLKQNFDFL